MVARHKDSTFAIRLDSDDSKLLSELSKKTGKGKSAILRSVMRWFIHADESDPLFQELIQESSAPDRAKYTHPENPRLVTGLLREQVLQRDLWRCRYCGTQIGMGARQIHVDHIIPYAQDGLTVIDNLATACARCNHKKHNKTPEQANMKLLPVPDA